MACPVSVPALCQRDAPGVLRGLRCLSPDSRTSPSLLCACSCLALHPRPSMAMEELSGWTRRHTHCYSFPTLLCPVAPHLLSLPPLSFFLPVLAFLMRAGLSKTSPGSCKRSPSSDGGMGQPSRRTQKHLHFISFFSLAVFRPGTSQPLRLPQDA